MQHGGASFGDVMPGDKAEAAIKAKLNEIFAIADLHGVSDESQV